MSQEKRMKREKNAKHLKGGEMEILRDIHINGSCLSSGRINSPWHQASSGCGQLGVSDG